MSRQAKLKKFGIERTPYYKKFIKKPAIDKIVENRKRGVKNHYAEQYLIESLANRVRPIPSKQKIGSKGIRPGSGTQNEKTIQQKIRHGAIP
jgi:hypothetical protein